MEEPFEINLLFEVYTIIPNEIESFTVMLGDKWLCDIAPEANLDSGFTWSSDDDVSPDWVAQIGELVEEHFGGKKVIKFKEIERLLSDCEIHTKRKLKFYPIFLSNRFFSYSDALSVVKLSK